MLHRMAHLFSRRDALVMTEKEDLKSAIIKDVPGPSEGTLKKQKRCFVFRCTNVNCATFPRFDGSGALESRSPVHSTLCCRMWTSRCFAFVRQRCFWGRWLGQRKVQRWTPVSWPLLLSVCFELRWPNTEDRAVAALSSDQSLAYLIWCLLCIEDHTTHFSRASIISHFKDLYEPISIMEKGL